MSQCNCKNPRNFRITKEGDDKYNYRIRCADCSGKWGYINIEELIWDLKVKIEASEIKGG